MKANKLLVLLAALSLGLSACNKSGDEKDSKDGPTTESAEPGESGEQPTESGEHPTESEGQPEEDDFLYPYLDEGTSTGFPLEKLQLFLETYDMDLQVPAIGADTIEWSWYSYSNNGQYPVFELDAKDEGTIGTDSLEDIFCEALKDLYEIDSTDYDSSGYRVLDADDEAIMQWYTYEQSFHFWIYGPDYNYPPTDEFPYEIMQKIYNHYYGLKPEFPLPVSENEWYYGIEREYQSYYGYAYTLDDGEIGVNSIEDVYKGVLEEDGWQIDDALYDDDGYYAYKAEICIQFFSWDGEFYFYISPAPEESTLA